MAEEARKDITVKIRVNPVQLADMKYGAKKAGLDLSSWLRNLALKEADRYKHRTAGTKAR
jgi:hypothetical protein